MKEKTMKKYGINKIANIETRHLTIKDYCASNFPIAEHQRNVTGADTIKNARSLIYCTIAWMFTGNLSQQCIDALGPNFIKMVPVRNDSQNKYNTNPVPESYLEPLKDDDGKQLNGSVGISFDPITGKIRLEDGYHRKEYYNDFFSGAIVLCESDCIDFTIAERGKEEIMKFAVSENEYGEKIVAFSDLPEEIQTAFCNILIAISIIESGDRKIRAAEFQTPNAGKAMNGVTLMRSMYITTPMWRIVEGFNANITTKGSIVAKLGDEKHHFSGLDAVALKKLLPRNREKTMYAIARIGLGGGYLPEKVSKKYKWIQGDSMDTIAKKFYKACEELTESQCLKIFLEIVNNICYLANNIYQQEIVITETKNMQSLTTGMLMKRTISQIKNNKEFANAAKAYIAFISRTVQEADAKSKGKCVIAEDVIAVNNNYDYDCLDSAISLACDYKNTHQDCTKKERVLRDICSLVKSKKIPYDVVESEEFVYELS